MTQPMDADGITRIPDQKCWKCNAHMSGSATLVGDHQPSPGDICLCIQCGVPAVFDKEMRLRQLTNHEIDEWIASLEREDLQAAAYTMFVIDRRVKEKASHN